MVAGSTGETYSGHMDSSDAKEVLRDVWRAADEEPREQDDGPDAAKVCRNMVGVSFEGMVSDGTDLRTAWRAKLADEGKLGESNLHDLIFGKQESR
jgi:hypothetical protein